MPAGRSATWILLSNCWEKLGCPRVRRWCAAWKWSGARRSANCSPNCGVGRGARFLASGKLSWDCKLPKHKAKWDERTTAAANARRVLPRLAADYFKEVRDFLATDREPKEFHRMRLASKRFRYTLEL